MEYRKKSSESNDLYVRIRTRINDGKTDAEIAHELDLPTYRVSFIRTRLLKITYFNKQKLCQKCGKLKNICCFDSGAPKEFRGWCIICRREAGRDLYHRSYSVKWKKDRFVSEFCLTCGKPFESEIINARGHHYYTCPDCRLRNTEIERVSI